MAKQNKQDQQDQQLHQIALVSCAEVENYDYDGDRASSLMAMGITQMKPLGDEDVARLRQYTAHGLARGNMAYFVVESVSASQIHALVEKGRKAHEKALAEIEARRKAEQIKYEAREKAKKLKRLAKLEALAKAKQ